VTKSYRVLLFLWTLTALKCLGAGAQQLPSHLAQIPQRELALVQKFLAADRETTNCFATIAIKEEIYTVIMDLRHQKAVILNRDPEKEKSMGEVGARGFFAKDPKGAWIRESRGEFEMSGGIWMLDRFLQVLKMTEKAKFARFQWNT
jgi:hypothetical protein